jgi:hypothetical protein
LNQEVALASSRLDLRIWELNPGRRLLGVSENPDKIPGHE